MTADVRLAVVVLVMVMTCDASALGADRARDESEIRQLQARQQDAWNRHDAKAYAALFSEDGDIVNVVGWWWKGRREIERQLQAAFAVVFRDSRLTITDVEVRFLARDVAIAHVRWTMEGARTPAFDPRASAGHSNSGAAEAQRRMADRGLPEHEQPAPGAVSDGGIVDCAVATALTLRGEG